jgi:hypothetical protein
MARPAQAHFSNVLANTEPFEHSRQTDQQLDRLYSFAGQRNGASRDKTPIQQLPPNFEPDNPN